MNCKKRLVLFRTHISNTIKDWKAKGAKKFVTEVSHKSYDGKMGYLFVLGLWVKKQQKVLPVWLQTKEEAMKLFEITKEELLKNKVK